MKTAVVTARIPEDTLALIDQAVRQRGRSRCWFVAEAVKRAAHAQAEFDAFVQEGVDAIDCGDTVPHVEVMAKLGAMIAKYEKQCEG